MSVDKADIYEGGTLTLLEDDTFTLQQTQQVTFTKQSTALENYLQALAEAGIAPGTSMTKTVTAGYEMRMVRATVIPNSDTTATVKITWAISDLPVLDGDWVVETYSEVYSELRGYDINLDPITIQYANDDMMGDEDEATFLAHPWNARRYNRGVAVPAWDSRVHLVARRHVSAAGATALYPALDKWASYYPNYANAAVTGTMPAGFWRCAHVRVSTRNRGQTYMVEMEFVGDHKGHEAISVFVDTDGLQPGDITIPAGMKTAWPTVRSVSADKGVSVGGVVRPQMLKGTMDFNSAVSLDLTAYYQPPAELP